MQFKLVSISLMAAVASAQLSTSPSSSPSLSSSISSTATPSSTSSAAPSASVNAADFDCVYRGWGCDWKKSEYGYGADYCGSSPFKAGQQLSDGSQIVAVSKDGSGDCASKAGDKCCQVLAAEPCKRGEKYLECSKPQ
ncbi:uncharacterized protein N7529_009995 [Penicillium soppii]|uniref:uncharacterized protein n=1 Tax=Penicillium soppii TaxID=69789 RepID=UPI002547BB19|nr:uncharacterized protein N7529_009995 [Penicillium soppii]KAJ5856051.1 hypothetical protein N7529_009995 [Penicillium soppii]